MCEQAQVERAKAPTESQRGKRVKKDAEIQSKLVSALQKMKEKMEKSLTWRHKTLSARVCSYEGWLHLGVPTVAAYAVFKITKPFFFYFNANSQARKGDVPTLTLAYMKHPYVD